MIWRFVTQVSDEILVLRHGNMVEHGTVKQIIESPKQDYTKELVSAHSIQHEEKGHSDNPILCVENITASYGGATQVLTNVSVEIHPGQTLAVVGESGSGKSTLARVITGLLPPSRGRITFDGVELPKSLSERSLVDLRELQMIYQMADVAMNPRQTVRHHYWSPAGVIFWGAWQRETQTGY